MKVAPAEPSWEDTLPTVSLFNPPEHAPRPPPHARLPSSRPSLRLSRLSRPLHPSCQNGGASSLVFPPKRKLKEGGGEKKTKKVAPPESPAPFSPALSPARGRRLAVRGRAKGAGPERRPCPACRREERRRRKKKEREREGGAGARRRVKPVAGFGSAAPPGLPLISPPRALSFRPRLLRKGRSHFGSSPSSPLPPFVWGRRQTSAPPPSGAAATAPPLEQLRFLRPSRVSSGETPPLWEQPFLPLPPPPVRATTSHLPAGKSKGLCSPSKPPPPFLPVRGPAWGGSPSRGKPKRLPLGLW